MNFNLTDIQTAPSRNGLSMNAKFWINETLVADLKTAATEANPFCIFTAIRPRWN
jgi:hypothetical protein